MSTTLSALVLRSHTISRFLSRIALLACLMSVMPSYVYAAYPNLVLEPILASLDAREVALHTSDEFPLPPGNATRYEFYRMFYSMGNWVVTSVGETDDGQFTDWSVPMDKGPYFYVVWAYTQSGSEPELGPYLSNIQVFKRPFSIFIDPDTDRTVHQLTDIPGDNYALYYEFMNSNRGYKLVFRNIFPGDQFSQSGSNLAYYVLDLETGDTTMITPRGLCNLGTAHQNFLYAACRPILGGRYTEIKRFPLHLGELPTGAKICDIADADISAIDVNRDASFVIFLENNSESGPTDQVVSCEIATRNRKVRVATDDILLHLRFHPTNYNTFFYLNNSNDGLARLNIGKLREDDEHELFTSDPFLGDPDFKFNHPFFDTGGSYWCDIFPNGGPGNNPFHLVRFDMSNVNLGEVEGYDLFQDLDPLKWQNHYNSGPSDRKFVGDGQGQVSFARPFIQSLNLNPWTESDSAYTDLASSFGTHYDWYPSGTDEANVHYIRSMEWVVWSARRPLAVEDPNQLDDPSVPQNVFAVPYMPTFNAAP